MFVVKDVALKYKPLDCLADRVIFIIGRVVSVVLRGEVSRNFHKVAICSLCAILVIDVGDIICSM